MRLSDLVYPNHVQPKGAMKTAPEDRAHISGLDPLASSGKGEKVRKFFLAFMHLF